MGNINHLVKAASSNLHFVKKTNSNVFEQPVWQNLSMTSIYLLRSFPICLRKQMSSAELYAFLSSLQRIVTEAMCYFSGHDSDLNFDVYCMSYEPSYIEAPTSLSVWLLSFSICQYCVMWPQFHGPLTM